MAIHETSHSSAPCVSHESASDRQLLARFSDSNDQEAFAALVHRHGGTVRGVCRRALSNSHDADEAFQATFLVLARKSASLRNPELLTNWIYGVAYRSALKIRTRNAKRREHERKAGRLQRSEPDAEDRELRAILDEEMNRLPQKYRLPLVLSYLEGRTNQEIARLLGCPAGSVSWYLGKAKRILRTRLVKRGVALSAPAWAALFSQKTAAAAVPPVLVKSTAQTAVAAATSKAAGLGLSATLQALCAASAKATPLQKAAYGFSTAAIVLVCWLSLVRGAGAREAGRPHAFRGWLTSSYSLENADSRLQRLMAHSNPSPLSNAESESSPFAASDRSPRATCNAHLFSDVR